MSKISLALFAAAAGALIWVGVLEVRVHPENISKLSGTANQVFGDYASFAKAKAYGIALKRQAEQLIIRDEAKRFELTLLYIERDAGELNKLLEAGADIEAVAERARLLQQGLEQISEQADKVPIDTLASFKDTSREAIATAQQTLQTLKNTHERYTAAQEQFAQTVTFLEEQIGQFDLDGQVAGSQDRP